jgi:hypothetical protein
MSSKAPETVITAILVIIVLFIVAIIVLNSDTRETFVRIAGEVFHSESEEGSGTTIDAQKTLISNLEDCDNSGKYNLQSNDQCFCFTLGLGTITDQFYISIQNKDNKLTTTAFSANGAPLAQSVSDYNLGLMVVDQKSDELSCVFPGEFFIKGVDEGGYPTLIPGLLDGSKESNNLYVVWNDERANKDMFKEGSDYTFKFYREGNEEDYPELAPAPVLYRVDESHYCLITDLLEYSTTSSFYLTSSDDTKAVITDKELMRIAEEHILEQQAIESLASKKFESLVIPFLLDDSKYCNKL